MGNVVGSRKLWIVNQYATPPSLPGITRHYSLGKHLVEKGWDVTVFTSNYRHETREDFISNLKSEFHKESFDGVEFVFVRQKFAYKSNSISRILNILEFGKNVYKVMSAEASVKPPNIVIGSSFHFLNPEAAFMLARKRGAVPLLEIRDLWPEALIYLRNISEHHPIVHLLTMESKRLYGRSEGVIALSPAIEKKVKQYFPTKRTLILPNPVDIELFSNVDLKRWKDLEPVKRLVNSNAKIKLIYIGTIGEANAFETIYEAAKLLREYDIEFFVIGHGEKFQEYSLRSKDEKLKVFFYRPIPKLAIPTLLSVADGLIAAIHPSFALYGGSMNKLNDYMISGKPIFYSGPRENTPFESVDCAEIVEPLNAAALSEKVRAFYLNPEPYRERARFCRKYAEENLSSNHLAARLHEFLKYYVT